MIFGFDTVPPLAISTSWTLTAVCVENRGVCIWGSSEAMTLAEASDRGPQEVPVGSGRENGRRFLLDPKGPGFHFRH